MTNNRTIILIAALVVAVLAGAWLWKKGDETVTHAPSGETSATTKTTGQPQVGGPFTLVDQNGKTVSDTDFRGKYMLIYFGFTFCPDVCPTELQVISAALEHLGAKGAAVQPMFVSVDPERDTPEVLAKYVKQFDPRLIGLTGSPAQIAGIAKEYRVFYEKVADKDSSADYTMDHSSVAYLMSPEGKFLTFFPPGISPEQMSAKIESYM